MSGGRQWGRHGHVLAGPDALDQVLVTSYDGLRPDDAAFDCAVNDRSCADDGLTAGRGEVRAQIVRRRTAVDEREGAFDEVDAAIAFGLAPDRFVKAGGFGRERARDLPGQQ